MLIPGEKKKKRKQAGFWQSHVGPLVSPEWQILLSDAFLGNDADLERISSVDISLCSRHEHVFNQLYGFVERQWQVLHVFHVFVSDLHQTRRKRF